MFLSLSARADERERTLADWRNRMDRVQSVRYTVTGTVETKKEVIADLLKGLAGKKNIVIPPESPPSPIKAVVLIDLTKKRFRIDQSETIFSQASKRYVPLVKTIAYNGKTYQTAIPREQNESTPSDPDVFLSKGDLEQMSVDVFFWPVFEAHGLVPTVNVPLRPDKLPIQHELDELDARGMIEHGGRRCAVLRTEPLNVNVALSDEFLVDQSRESAILRHIRFNGTNPWYRLDVTHHDTPHGWLPKSWTVTWTTGGHVATVHRLTAVSFEVNPQLREDDFTLPIKPGMIVYTDEYPAVGTGLDPERPRNGTYRVEPSGRWVELNSKGFTTIEGVELPRNSRRGYWWWVVGVAGTTVPVVAVMAWLRKRRKR
jgi:hypothetical protein